MVQQRQQAGEGTEGQTNEVCTVQYAAQPLAINTTLQDIELQLTYPRWTQRSAEQV